MPKGLVAKLGGKAGVIGGCWVASFPGFQRRDCPVYRQRRCPIAAETLATSRTSRRAVRGRGPEGAAESATCPGGFDQEVRSARLHRVLGGREEVPIPQTAPAEV